MKKRIMIGVISLLLSNLSSLGFAASYGKSLGVSYMIVEGTVVSVDKAKNTLAIKDRDDGKIYGLSTYNVSSLNQGDNVRVKVTLPGNFVSQTYSK